jgi:hypothetical protein
VFELVHGVVVAAVAEPVNCVVEPAQTVSVPVIIGLGFTVIIRVYCVFELSLYLIVSVPAVTPVTVTVFVVEFETVATVGVEETHVFEVAGTPLPVNVIIDPTQTEFGPEI